MIMTRNKLLDISTTLVRPNDFGDDDSLPYYQMRHREKRGESKQKTWFYELGNGNREPNAHQSLLLCGMSGPGLVLNIIRTCSFLATVYFSLMVFHVGGGLTCGIHRMEVTVLGVVFPGIMMCLHVPQLYILCTSSEMMHRRHIIHEVDHDTHNLHHFLVSALIGYARHILKADCEHGTASTCF